MILALGHGLSFTDMAILFAAGAWLVRTVLETSGRSVSAKTLRETNRDLREQLSAMGGRVAELETELKKAVERSHELELQVKDLRLKDVSALYDLVSKHDERMQRWATEMTVALSTLADRVGTSA